MKPRKSLSFITTAVALVLAVASAPTLATGPNQPPRGTVYVMSNASSGNAVLVFNRRADGRLDPAGSFPSGGLGTGGSLGNQNSLILHPSHRWLYAVDAGSSEISVFRVLESGLEPIQTLDSGGAGPISIAIHDESLYVLNEGAGALSDNIQGFRILPDGTLQPLGVGSSAFLSAPLTDPAQIEFSPDGRFLIVTEKATDLIDVFEVDENDLLGSRVSVPSAGQTPFGFAFGRRNQLFVSEAGAGAPGGGSVSSYELLPSGDLSLIQGAISTTETATCWVVIGNDGRFAYVTNTGSESLSTFNIAFDGTIRLRRADGIAGRTGRGTTPIDLALSPDQRNLYALDNTRSRIVVFRAPSDGGLVRLQFVGGVPPGANGIAVR